MNPSHSYAEAVEVFLAKQTHLTEEDEPMVFALRDLAKRLDAEFSNALMNQFGLAYRRLARKDKPGQPKKIVDPFEELLDGR